MNARARSPVAFGPYIITRRIARGGMAEIYRARSRKGDTRWVAVKMMRPSLGHEELRTRLFQREARIASKMAHDNIVPVYEYGSEMDRPYLAMEYIRGRDLSHLLKNEKKGRELIDYEVGLYIGLLASAGLGHAHRLVDEEIGPLGIVHRDISPGNVMIGYDGLVKVLDFGVARMNETQGVHTQTGTLRGKFAYMSPEQTLGEELDARSDVFSLGTVLYELLTGINCFRAQNPIATLERVQGLRPVPPSRANRAIPKVVDRILARCLAKDKKRRFKDCRALEEAIGDFLDRRRPDLRERLMAHMEKEFSWEKHEEEQELTREEEEVALFDVVDFALLSEVGALDARNVKVAEDEEASQAEVKRRRIKKEEEGQEVFDEASAHEQPTSRITHELRLASQQKALTPSDFGDEEDATVAQPSPFEHSEDQILAGELRVSSLLHRNDELNPLFSRAAVPDAARYLTDPGTAPPTIVPQVSLPFYKRPATAGIAIALLVLVVAVGVMLGTQEAESVEVEEPEIAPTTTLDPITLTLDEEGTARTKHKVGREAPPPPVARMPPVTPAPPPTAVEPVDSAEGSAQTNVVKVDPAQVDRAEAAKLEAAKLEAAKLEAAKLEAAKLEAAELEAAKLEAAKAEAEKRKLDQEKLAASQPPPPAPPAPPPVRTPPPPPPPARVEPPQKKKAQKRAVAKKPTPTGFLNVGARPWAHITIDGKRWPYQTPQAGIELPAGKHTLVLTNDETGVSKTQSVIIKSGAYRTVMLDMRKK